MGTAERRNEIMKKLCRRRYDTIANLASEFGVSERTIRRDIDVMSATEPIYTQTGRCGGGIYVIDGYSLNRMYMSEEEIAVLHKLQAIAERRIRCVLSDCELEILKRIIIEYTKPIHHVRKEKQYETK